MSSAPHPASTSTSCRRDLRTRCACWRAGPPDARGRRHARARHRRQHRDLLRGQRRAASRRCRIRTPIASCAIEETGRRRAGTTGYFSFDALRPQQQSFESHGGDWRLVGDARRRRQDAERVVGARVTWEYFRTLGLRPRSGRDFEARTITPSAAASRSQRRAVAPPLQRRSAIIGKPITINR